eukprot:6329278-Pyramimonas_sp.AAC.1
MPRLHRPPNVFENVIYRVPAAAAALALFSFAPRSNDVSGFVRRSDQPFGRWSSDGLFPLPQPLSLFGEGGPSPSPSP